MSSKHDPLTEALRRMPVPPIREGFVDEALVQATRAASPAAHAGIFGRRETWLGIGLGSAAAAIAAMLLLRPDMPVAPNSGVTLAVNESRNVDVLIDSERTLDDATIHIAASGAIELDGLEDRHEIRLQTRVERGRNVLSLPVVARMEGDAQLVAVVEHQGRKREIALRFVVKPVRGRIA